MKLKYYLRGLGLGIILTTLILVIAGPKGKLSDKEIMSRAKELGMVEKTEDNSGLDSILGKTNLTGTPAPGPSKAVKPNAEPTIEPTINPKAEPTKKPITEPTQKPDAFPTYRPIPTQKPIKEIKSTGTGSKTEGTGDITFSIKSGMSSGKVAKMLVNKGLIENADEFNQYIVSVGKAGIIRIGDYTMPKGSSYEDIIEKITSK